MIVSIITHVAVAPSDFANDASCSADIPSLFVLVR
jgi:hypothetical protein